MCGLQKHLQPVEGFKQAIWALALWWRRWHTFAFQLFQSPSNLPESGYWENFNKKKNQCKKIWKHVFSSKFEQMCSWVLDFFPQSVFEWIYFHPKKITLLGRTIYTLKHECCARLSLSAGVCQCSWSTHLNLSFPPLAPMHAHLTQCSPRLRPRFCLNKWPQKKRWPAPR